MIPPPRHNSLPASSYFVREGSEAKALKNEATNALPGLVKEISGGANVDIESTATEGDKTVSRLVEGDSGDLLKAVRVQ